MKKLTRDELNKVSGGDNAPAELCTTKCYTGTGQQLSCIKSIGGCIMPTSCSNTSECK